MSKTDRASQPPLSVAMGSAFKPVLISDAYLWVLLTDAGFWCPYGDGLLLWVARDSVAS